MLVQADLHIHSCLSPCASLEMSPSAIVNRAEQLGFSLLCLTDHNSTLNCGVFRQLCMEAGIGCLCGMELTTREEIHVLAVFSDDRQAEAFGETVYRLLPDMPNVPETLGDQVIVDRNEVITGEAGKYLGNATDIGIDEAAEMILDAGGLFIPAHIERPLFSVISQLGFVPDLPYSALESVSRDHRGNAVSHFGRQVPVIRNSDAHTLSSLGRRFFTFEAELPDFSALKTALEKRTHTPYQRS